MINIETFKKTINGRPVVICLGGKSIEELNQFIESFRNENICWIGLNQFEPAETILAKIDKKMSIVYDSVSTKEELSFVFEEKTRLPRLKEFLSRDKNNILITTHGIVRDVWSKKEHSWFLDTFKDQIFEIDSVFPPEQIGDWMSVPNSATLTIAAAYAGGASKIALLGCDGNAKGISSYYLPEFHIEERATSIGQIEDLSINSASLIFEKEIVGLIKRYRELFNNKAPLVNCSYCTRHLCLPIIYCSSLLDFLKGNIQPDPTC